jgi:hypothetical protein
MLMDRIQFARELYRDWIGKEISDETLARRLIPIWVHVENPERVLSKTRWLQLFRAAGFLSDYGASPPSEPIEVWRSQIGTGFGMAWTRSEEVARWFHDTKHRPYRQEDSALLRTLIEPNGVLALIRKSRIPLQLVDGRLETVAGRRGEDEVVVDPSLLRRPVVRVE